MSRPLTVVQLVPAMESGGVERGTMEVAAELVRQGHRSIVISGGGRLVDNLIDEGSEHVTWSIGKKSPWSLRWVRRLRRFLQEQQVDVVHARSRVPAWIGWLAWRGMDPHTRPRFLTTVHSLYSVSRYSEIMMRGERLIAISKTVERYILNNYPHVDPAKIHLIYRGIDSQEFPYGYRPSENWLSRWHENYPQLHNAPILTLPGRLVRRKGHLEFLEMMSRLKEHGITVQGILVGGEDPNRKGYADTIRRTIAERGLDNVTLVGHRSDMREIYAISDVVYCVSAHPEEAFGRTVVEAARMGRPVIGYNHGGVGETLSALFPEGLIDVENREQLFHRTVDFLKRKPVVAPSDHFQRSEMLRQTLELYREIAASHQSHRRAA